MNGAVEQQDAADEVRAFTMAALAADLGVLRIPQPRAKLNSKDVNGSGPGWRPKRAWSQGSCRACVVETRGLVPLSRELNERPALQLPRCSVVAVAAILSEAGASCPLHACEGDIRAWRQPYIAEGRKVVPTAMGGRSA
jgi:hypothetical protein